MVYRSFAEARLLARSLNLPTLEDWLAWAHSAAKPPDIPIYPDNMYRAQGWSGWRDWLGGARPVRRTTFLSFEDARTFAQTLRLSGKAAWMAWVKTDARPATIPADPRDVYGGAGWNGWGDWLGTGNCASTAYTFRPFAEARAYARSLNIATIAAWTLWARSEERPRDIPMQPDNHYRGAGWQGWGDWLGTERIAPYVTPPPRYRPFKNARDFARSLELSTSKAWFAWARTSACPVDIPVYPHLVYRGDGWFGYGDWLGTGIARFTRTYRPFHQARIYARSLGVTSQEAWYTWCKTDVRPSDIPIEPRAMYMGRGWKGWGDWLGTGTKPVYKRVYLSYEQGAGVCSPPYTRKPARMVRVGALIRTSDEYPRVAAGCIQRRVARLGGMAWDESHCRTEKYIPEFRRCPFIYTNAWTDKLCRMGSVGAYIGTPGKHPGASVAGLQRKRLGEYSGLAR